MSIERVILGGDELELTVLPDLGARLHSLKVRGHEVLRSPTDLAAHAREPFFWGGYVMAPWCNRLAARPTDIGKDIVELAPNFPDGSAIHGQVYDVPWRRRDEDMFFVERVGDGWPWP